MYGERERGRVRGERERERAWKRKIVENSRDSRIHLSLYRAARRGEITQPLTQQAIERPNKALPVSFEMTGRPDVSHPGLWRQRQ